MGSLYKVFHQNIKQKPNQIYIYSLIRKYDGTECLQKLKFLRKLIKTYKIETIGINYQNSADWILWYLAADSYDKKIILIKNNTPKKIVNKIKKKFHIDFIATQIPKNSKINIRSVNKVRSKRCDVIFTSGSTSFPKGVVINEKAYLHVANILRKKLKQKKNDIELLSMPFDHSFGLVRLRCCILAGTKMLVTDGLKKFPEIFKFSQGFNLTGLSLVPSGLALIKILLKDKVDLFTKKIKYFEIGSSNINYEMRCWLKEKFLKTKIIHHYGMTEASRSFLIYRGKNDNLKIDSNMIGKIIPGCKFKIIKRKKNEGELILKGKNLFNGYFEKKNDKNKFINGWFKTGDIVKNIDKKLYLIGRIDNQFNIGGNKVQAEMIEDTIEKINGVNRCVCFTIPDEIYGNRLGLIIEKKNNVNKNKLINIIEKKMMNMPDFYAPKKILFKKIPLTKNGKKIRNL